MKITMAVSEIWLVIYCRYVEYRQH